MYKFKGYDYTEVFRALGMPDDIIEDIEDFRHTDNFYRDLLISFSDLYSCEEMAYVIYLYCKAMRKRSPFWIHHFSSYVQNFVFDNWEKRKLGAELIVTYFAYNIETMWN